MYLSEEKAARAVIVYTACTHCFGRAQSVRVVVKACRNITFCIRGKTSAVFPRHGYTVAVDERVAYRVIGDRCIVILCQQIAPCAVGVFKCAVAVFASVPYRSEFSPRHGTQHGGSVVELLSEVKHI